MRWPRSWPANHESDAPSSAASRHLDQPRVPLPASAGRGWREAPGEGNSSRRRPLTPPRYPRPSMTMLDHARRMRRAPTRSEDRLWSWLRDRRFSGQKFRRQVPIGRYILDFYCPRLKLVIEIPLRGTFSPAHAGAKALDQPRGWREAPGEGTAHSEYVFTSPGLRSILSTSEACVSSAYTICRAYSSSQTSFPSTCARRSL